MRKLFGVSISFLTVKAQHGGHACEAVESVTALYFSSFLRVLCVKSFCLSNSELEAVCPTKAVP
jgi:hypothetical protein